LQSADNACWNSDKAISGIWGWVVTVACPLHLDLVVVASLVRETEALREELADPGFLLESDVPGVMLGYLQS
jgi:hypothetical protein